MAAWAIAVPGCGLIDSPPSLQIGRIFQEPFIAPLVDLPPASFRSYRPPASLGGFFDLKPLEWG